MPGTLRPNVSGGIGASAAKQAATPATGDPMRARTVLLSAALVTGLLPIRFPPAPGEAVTSYAARLAGWPDDRPVWTGSPAS